MNDTLAVKRILREYKEICKSPFYAISAHPLSSNLYEWHFTFRGPEDSVYEGGRYHGRILLPSTYPFKPPDIIMLNKSGRFEIDKKICLSVTGYHPKSWQSTWNVRTILLALRTFMLSPAEGAIGSLSYSDDEKRKIAKESGAYCCSVCKKSNLEFLPELTEEETENIKKGLFNKPTEGDIKLDSISFVAPPKVEDETSKAKEEEEQIEQPVTTTTETPQTSEMNSIDEHTTNEGQSSVTETKGEVEIEEKEDVPIVETKEDVTDDKNEVEEMKVAHQLEQSTTNDSSMTLFLIVSFCIALILLRKYLHFLMS